MPAPRLLPVAEVVDLASARADRQLHRWREQIAGVMQLNQQTFRQLYATGALFSDDGARAGRDLLRTHQHLLEVTAVLDRIQEASARSNGRNSRTLATLYRELDALVGRTNALTARTSGHVSRMRRCRSTAK